MRFWRTALPALLLALSVLACGRGNAIPRRELILYPSPTGNATQTPYVLRVTSPAETVIVVVTQTATPLVHLCVTAAEAVYLRPSPNNVNYPIIELPNGTVVTDLGGRDGNWLYVATVDGRHGWVNGIYITAEDCK